MSEADNPTRGKETARNHIWGLPLRRRKKTVIVDEVLRTYPRMRSEIVEKLLNDTCEICGAKEKVEMHHIRKLKDLNKKGKREMPLWMKMVVYPKSADNSLSVKTS